jgi:hypothetical protein
MAEFKLGRIRFVWKGAWGNGTTYYKDDIVSYGGKTFLCTIGHTAAADFYTDLDNSPTRWNQFSDGIAWRGDWNGTTVYKINDIVKYGGLLYIANDGHTSQSTLEVDQAKWELLAESFDWKESWDTSIVYKVNDLVSYGGNVYVCNEAHTSASTAASGLEADQAKWDLFSKGIDWKSDWNTNTRYKVNDVVKYGGTIYVCNTAHTSASTAADGLELDQAKWDYFNRGFEYKGTWSGSLVRYKINDIVKYGSGTWICTTQHTSQTSFITDLANWAQFVEGIEYENDWTSGTVYQNGDIVRYGGNSYIAKTTHLASSSPPSDSTNYDLFTEGFSFQEDWSNATPYKIGEVVRLNGFTYVAIADSTGQEPPNATYWSKLNEGIKWQSTWQDATPYKLGDAVKYGAFSYICVLGHTSAAGSNRPDLDTLGTYWNLLTAGNEESALTTQGDLVYYSGAGPARLPIGDEGQILTVSGGLPIWTYFGRTAKVFYVAPHGTNSPSPTYGLTVDQPWSSIRYACDQIEEGTEYRNAAYLLRQNRTFIQKEIVEWTNYQITNDIAPFTSGFTYDEETCQRDMGLLVDAVVYDMTHTGNVKSREAALAYFTELGASYIAGQEDETVASINYGLDVIEAVLSNTAPAANYQELNGISAGDRTLQIIDANYTTESGALDLITSLTAIVTDAITAGDTDDLPVEDVPNYTINVKTGAFYEVLPIIVPANTAVVGDELRGTRIWPAAKITADNDKAKSVAALTRLRNISDEIVINSSVSKSSGNIETQDTSSQNEGNVGSATAISRVQSAVAEIKDILENGEEAANAYVFPTPTGFGSSLINVAYASTGNSSGATTGYDHAVAQLEANRVFIKAEITAWIFDNYSDTATASSSADNTFTITDTSWMELGMPIRFAGTVFGGVLTGITYYVQSIPSGTKFTISTVRNSIDALPLTTASGTMTVQFQYDSAICARDVGLVIDALKYDTTYGGNTQTRIAADAYFSYGAPTYGTGEGTVTLAAYAHLKTIVGDVITETAITPSPSNGESQDTSGTAGGTAAENFVEARVQELYDTLDNDGTLATLIQPATSWVDAALVVARTKLDGLKSTVQSDAVQHIVKTYPTLDFNRTTCSRDVGYIVDAIGYDLMFGSNFASIKAGLAYRRGTTSAQLVVADQLAATLSILDFISKKSSYIAASGSSVLVQLIWDDAISYVNTGVEPIVIGTNNPDTDIDIINGARILELNKDFLAAEAVAYTDLNNNTTVSASSSSNNRFTVVSTSWMVAGDSIRFVGTTFGGVATGTTYFVKEVVNATEFTVSDTLDGTVRTLTNGSGTMTVQYYYDSAAYLRDAREFVDAAVKDLIYTGNYYSLLAARYYRNALTGSKLENMFLVRNGCGLRNCTVNGLDGSSDGNTSGIQDPYTTANEFGTRRPNAGAYVSLDPGWGPNDTRVWITSKSTYVQNVTTFGTGATGQKIDGALHAGGNDSIVSNDFTQVISDGIGAWITNLGRAELVSVFSYYAHIGYLAENGGKIRATNGNNSYGDFGSVAEGIDVTETPITGKINNRNTEANVINTLVDGTRILAFEYGNTGSEYTSATFSISGAGASAAARADEFRDGAVFNVRLTDPGDSSGTGGIGYVNASNQAQSGNTNGSITLAAADAQASGVYIGMRLDITAGTGSGMYGYIQSYNAGSKIATIYKYSTGTQGWDHVIPGWPLSTPDVTSTYEITPSITIDAPPFSKTKANLSASRDWSDIAYGNGIGSYTAISASGGTGNFATFNVSRVNGVYTVEIVSPGTLYTANDTLTIAGANLGGATTANNLIITLTSVTSPSGSITEITWVGNAVSPKFIAVAKDSNVGAYSSNGIDWLETTLPTATGPGASNQYTAIAYGTVNGVGYFIAVARESTTAAYSTDGITWGTGNLQEVADWSDIAYGNGTFVAIAESDSSTSIRALTSNGGATWSAGTVASGAKAIAYGGTRFVVVEGNFSDSVAYSTNGSTWTVTTLPANDDSAESNWVDIAYGNGRYVAISDSSAMAAYSFDGATWYKSNLPADAEWTSVRYGQGVFYATTYGSIAASSPDGVTWTLRDATYQEIDIIATAKDTNAGYIARTLPHTAYWTDVIWDGAKFIAIGHDNGVTPLAFGASSADGETWTTVSLPLVSSQFEYTALAYNGSNLYVAILANTRHISTSADGITWAGTVNAIPTSSSQWSDMAYGATRFVAVSASSNRTTYSSDGITWTNGTTGLSENTAIAYGDVSGTGYFVVVSGLTSDSTAAAYSTDGISFSAATLPTNTRWSSVAYGDEIFVAVAGNTATTTTTAAYSTDGGQNWSSATLPGAAARWIKVVYGGGAFTAFAYNSNRTAYSDDGGQTWVEGPALTTTANWNTAAYGNSRLAVLATGGTTVANSNNFVLNTNLLTTSSGTTDLNVNDRIKFVFDSAGAEVFGGVNPDEDKTYYVKSIANSTQFTIAETIGGANFVLSTGSGSMLATVSKNYTAGALGNYLGTPIWAVVSSGSQGLLNISQGAQAKLRAEIVSNTISRIKILEPGSGYLLNDGSSRYQIEIVDPNNTGSDATSEVRIGNGALAQPTFTNRGTGYTAAAAEIQGDGYADNYQVSAFIGVKDLNSIPRGGSNVRINGIDDVYYRLVNVTNIQGTGPYSATLQVSPALGAAESPEHETDLNIRIRYSQVRLTGHDFLDIGTGNFTQTNYPGLPFQDPIPANETVDSNGGRVFYTSTDQDGNFRVGGLFNVEQSTGVATLNADAFNIAGLNELSLGSVALGGSGATISEFSTDPFFTADSDSVIPTQRAVKAYITSQIGGGGSSLNVNTLTAGVVFVAGQSISTTTDVEIIINTKVNFKGGIAGDALVLNYFLLNN